MNSRLFMQLEFLKEIDKIKDIFRKTKLFNGSRYENDAEHAWHISIMALILAEYANDKVDLPKVIKMLLIHDIVEIDAGDVVVYDIENRERIRKEEIKAANRIFSLLPKDQSKEYLLLWQEFEERASNEAKFAAALDRIEPILQNYYTNGETWKEFNVSQEKVLTTNYHIQEGSEILWVYVEKIIKETFAQSNIGL